MATWFAAFMFLGHDRHCWLFPHFYQIHPLLPVFIWVSFLSHYPIIVNLQYLVDRYQIPWPPFLNISEAVPQVCDCLSIPQGNCWKDRQKRNIRTLNFTVEIRYKLMNSCFRVVFWFFKFRSNWWLNIRRAPIQESEPIVYQSSMWSLVFQATITAADPALGEALLQSAPKRDKPQDAAKYKNG